MLTCCKECISIVWRYILYLHQRTRQKADCYKASVLKLIIPTSNPGNDILPKIAILDCKLDYDDNKEYQICLFIAKC